MFAKISVYSKQQSLLDGDVRRLGLLFTASHQSLRDDHEVTVSAVDRLVEFATADRDVLGARMTGGGVRGAVVTPPPPALAALSRVGLPTRTARAGGHPTMLVPAALQAATESSARGWRRAAAPRLERTRVPALWGTVFGMAPP
jgi:hypothetical protein